jgi:hypothetical protein
MAKFLFPRWKRLSVFGPERQAKALSSRAGDSDLPWNRRGNQQGQGVVLQETPREPFKSKTSRTLKASASGENGFCRYCTIGQEQVNAPVVVLTKIDIFMSLRLRHTVFVKCLNEHLGNWPGFTTFDLVTFQHEDEFTVTEKGH